VALAVYTDITTRDLAYVHVASRAAIPVKANRGASEPYDVVALLPATGWKYCIDFISGGPSGHGNRHAWESKRRLLLDLAAAAPGSALMPCPGSCRASCSSMR
jgi:hypothetical protein